ncbi:MAG: ROK family protein [Ilumatobacteraceae bacterium]
MWPALARLVRRVLAAAPSRPLGCGVGCGGPMNPDLGTVAPLHIPSLKDFPLGAQVEELTHLPTVVDNNAKAVALAEAWRSRRWGCATSWPWSSAPVSAAGS